jgi:HSP20 family protein
MWRDNSDDLEAFERNFNAIFARTLAGEGSLFDMESKSLKPLFRIEATDEFVTVTLDLPYVEKKDVTLSSTEETLSIEAKMRKPVKLRLGAAQRTHTEFKKYTKKIRMPVRVDPTGATARFMNGLLIVKLPVLHKGKAVKIG